MSKKITIVLADDELLFRQGMKAILESDQDIQILFDASDGSDLINLLRTNAEVPEIIIMDLKNLHE